MRNSYKILVGKPEGKRSLEGHRCRWEDTNIRMDLREVGWELGECWLLKKGFRPMELVS
jgi:hypothetical protein